MSSTNAVRNLRKWWKGNCDGVSPFSFKKAFRASSRNVQQTARWASCNEADQPWASLAGRQTASSTKKLKVSGFFLYLDGWVAVGKVNGRYMGVKEIGFNTLDTR